VSEQYLDTNKSVIISSPAGSGKTEKLARRYISLLERGSDVEKVLCITFTEKAAAEMKHRILSILEKENPALLDEIRLKVPLMRISTIHAFCLRLLKRFSVELGHDPSLGVVDELAARELWVGSVYECLIEERENPSGFFHMISDRGIKGWNSVQRALEELHKKRPYPEMMLRDGQELEGESADVFSLYIRCLEKYSRKKRERQLVDFQDLELMVYEALSRGPEWHNILYAFDEHTDHILVDEFQDTSTLQWKIIEKLTEEWRSGMGAKRDKGKTPTIFLVGDEKQSIYRFRGANVSVFHHAKDNFKNWLGDEYHFVEARENYRSLPAIVDFVNRLFSHLMPGGEPLKSWMTGYTPFMPERQGEGAVELVLLEAGENTKETRAKEARALASTIRALCGKHEIYDEEGVKRPCRYRDMAILLRSRTHLALYEDAMRTESIPFVMLKGIGFYDAPEVAALRELVSFIVDPTDDYSLFAVLRSPLFLMEPATLTNLMKGKDPAIDKLRESDSRKMRAVAETLNKWIEQANESPLSVTLEQALTESDAWSKYWEPQRHANIKKFLALVESYESAGLLPIEVREKLLRQRFANEIAKANINAESMDAVRILTIHAAKGLQFPMVFVPSLDESITQRTGPVIVDDDDGAIRFLYEEDPTKRRKIEAFRMNLLKEQEEEKRLFYVALTRARDYLMMLGSLKEGKPTGRLAWLSEAFDIMEPPDRPLPIRILREEDITERSMATGLEFEDAARFVNAPAYTEPLIYSPRLGWKDVTEETDPGHGHGENWVVVGRAMHRLFEEISNNIIKEKDITDRLRVMLAREGITDGDVLETVLGDVLNLSRVGLLREIVLPARNSYTELPFVLKKGDNIFKGRIDRVILKPDRANIYDYKTVPIRESEIPELVEKYGFQMRIYKEAAERLFNLKTKSYLLFTHLPRVVEV
jgi:ATP-dependent helicase/nuclease subunit A